MDVTRSQGTRSDLPCGAAPVECQVPCIRCEYDLRGLPSGGNCPECYEPVSHSLRRDQLSLADPTWLRRLRRGTTCLLWAGGIAAVHPIEFYLVENTITNWNDFQVYVQHMISATMVIVATLIAVAGGWMITQAEPARPPQRVRNSRQIARIALLAHGLLILGTWHLFLAGIWLWVVVGVLREIAGAITDVALLSYGRQLAMRIPDRWLSGVAWLGICGCVVGCGVGIVSEVTVYLHQQALDGAVYGYWTVADLHRSATWAYNVEIAWGILVGISLLAFLLQFRRQVQRILDA